MARLARHLAEVTTSQPTPTTRSIPLEKPSVPPTPEEFWARHWYVVFTKPNRDVGAAREIRSLGHATYVPVLSKWVRRSGVQMAVERSLIPGYVLLGSTAPNPDWHAIGEAYCVGGYLGHDGLAVVVPRENLIELAGRQVLGEFDYTRAGAPIFVEGQVARITGGAFAGFNGTVDQDVPGDEDAARSIAVIVCLLGRDSVVHIPLADLREDV